MLRLNQQTTDKSVLDYLKGVYTSIQKCLWSNSLLLLPIISFHFARIASMARATTLISTFLLWQDPCLRQNFQMCF